MRLFITQFVFIVSILLSSLSLAYQAENFTQAKKTARMIWSEHKETFYCGCEYDRYGVIDYRSCGFEPSDPRKSKRISWEHVVPASWYGHHLSCWRQQPCLPGSQSTLKGRECCRKISDEFRIMEADLHNLVPAVPELNMARRHYAYAQLSDAFKSHVQKRLSCCDFYLDEQQKAVEPRDEVKGMAARITLYMADKYKLSIKKQTKQLMHDWDRRFPPSEWEIRWHQQVSALQGDSNPYIQFYEKNKNRG